MCPADAASFCGSRIVRDYEAPLRALPPASPVPSSLPFAPPGLRATPFRSTGEGLLYRGVRPSLNLWGDGTRIDLNWNVKLLVSRPAADGSVGEVVSETTGWVGEVGGSHVLVAKKALAELGTYRVDTSFESQSGEVLGSYFEYVQAIPVTWRVRLALNRRVVSPGGLVQGEDREPGNAGGGLRLSLRPRKAPGGAMATGSPAADFLNAQDASPRGQGRCMPGCPCLRRGRSRALPDTKAGLPGPDHR